MPKNMYLVRRCAGPAGAHFWHGGATDSGAHRRESGAEPRAKHAPFTREDVEPAAEHAELHLLCCGTHCLRGVIVPRDGLRNLRGLDDADGEAYRGEDESNTDGK